MVSAPGFFSASLSGAQSSGAGAEEELDAAEGWSPAFVDSSTGAQATVAGSRALGWEGSSRQIDPAAVDGGLQLAVLWARQAGAGSTLPMAIGECRVLRPGAVEAEVRCVVVAQRADDVTAACGAKGRHDPDQA